MQTQRLKHIAFSLCVVLSLFTSSIAACLCHDAASTESHCESEVAKSHSPESKAENHSSDTEHSPRQSASKTPHENISTDDSSIEISLEECCCVSSAPKAVAKSETVKIEKQTADYQPNAPPSIDLSIAVNKIKAIRLAEPFYLSDSFYNLKSPRGPPRL